MPIVIQMLFSVINVVTVMTLFIFLNLTSDTVKDLLLQNVYNPDVKFVKAIHLYVMSVKMITLS